MSTCVNDSFNVFVCQKCERDFSSKKALQAHVRQSVGKNCLELSKLRIKRQNALSKYRQDNPMVKVTSLIVSVRKEYGNVKMIEEYLKKHNPEIYRKIESIDDKIKNYVNKDDKELIKVIEDIIKKS